MSLLRVGVISWDSEQSRHMTLLRVRVISWGSEQRRHRQMFRGCKQFLQYWRRGAPIAPLLNKELCVVSIVFTALHTLITCGCFVLKESPISSFLNSFSFLLFFANAFFTHFFSFNTNSAMKNKTEEKTTNNEKGVTCNYPPCTYSNTGDALKVHVHQHHSDVVVNISEGWRSVAFPTWLDSRPVLKCEHCEKKKN